MYFTTLGKLEFERVHCILNKQKCLEVLLFIITSKEMSLTITSKFEI